MKKQKAHRFKKTTLGATLFGVIISTAVFFSVTLLGAIIGNSLPDPLSAIRIISFVSLLISGAASGFITAKFKGEGGLIPAFLSSAIFALICLFAGLIMTDCHLPLVTMVNLIIYVLAASLFAILAKRGKEKRKRH